MAEPVAPQPDDKDWTWATERVCDECGFDPTSVDRQDLSRAIEATTARWTEVLARPDAGSRPAPAVWSALEYGCHVRDVHSTFAGRVRSMLALDNPRFANWDQDATAVAERYWEQDPPTVARELAAAAQDAGAAFEDASDDASWDRPGTRSNGSVFTVESIGRYYLHDVVHHLHDVRG